MTTAALASAAASSFLASLVECIEALTVVLAVGGVRGWRGALGGAAAALITLVAAVAVMGRGVTSLPLGAVQIVIGALALPFGLRWLRKAVRRAAGILPLRNEDAAYAREVARQRSAEAAAPIARRAWDAEAFATCFKVTAIEGVEVVFIVLAAGAGGAGVLKGAAAGAAAALALVILLGLFLHRPISAIPENTLKFGVGVMLTAFGAFWLGEGSGLRWPGGDFALFGLTLAILAASLAAVALLRRGAARKASA